MSHAPETNLPLDSTTYRRDIRASHHSEMTQEKHDDGRVHVHAVPMKVLITIFAALLVGTALTVMVTWIDLGKINIVLALAIAFAKAILVALYFMHLRWDTPFNSVTLIAAMLFVTIFLGMAVLDTEQYKPNLTPPAGFAPAAAAP